MLHPSAPQPSEGSLGVTTAIVDRHETVNQLLLGKQNSARLTVGIEDEQFDRAITRPVGISDRNESAVNTDLPALCWQLDRHHPPTRKRRPQPI
jgi:hypothetical protein